MFNPTSPQSQKTRSPNWRAVKTECTLISAQEESYNATQSTVTAEGARGRDLMIMHCRGQKTRVRIWGNLNVRHSHSPDLANGNERVHRSEAEGSFERAKDCKIADE